MRIAMAMAREDYYWFDPTGRQNANAKGEPVGAPLGLLSS
jgi:hypothetical protein